MNKPLVLVLSLLGIVFLIGAIYYWVTPANTLLPFLPGYDTASMHPHIKHGLAAFVLAIGCGIVAWFSMGKKTSE